MTDTYWAEREGARWDIYGKQRGWMAQADTEDDARLIVAGLEALQAPPAAAPDCGACPGDGSMCPKVCRHAEENPPAAAVPEGYALVPVEPTEAMLDEGGKWTDAYAVWAAMLAAAERKAGES